MVIATRAGGDKDDVGNRRPMIVYPPYEGAQPYAEGRNVENRLEKRHEKVYEPNLAIYHHIAVPDPDKPP